MKNIARICFVLFFVLVVVPASAQVSTEERQLLLDIYNATGGSSWNSQTDSNPNNDWDFSGPVTNNWHGITLSGNQLTDIELPYNNLSGNISSRLELTENLQRLVLSNNPNLSFSGAEIVMESFFSSIDIELLDIGSISQLTLENEANMTLLLDEFTMIDDLRNGYGGTITFASPIYIGISGIINNGNIWAPSINTVTAGATVNNTGTITSEILNQGSVDLDNSGIIDKVTNLTGGSISIDNDSSGLIGQLTGEGNFNISNSGEITEINTSTSNLSFNIFDDYEGTQIFEIPNSFVPENQFPDLTNNNDLQRYDISGVNIGFGPLENQFTNLQARNLSLFEYSPLRGGSINTIPDATEGDNVTITATVSGTANHYQWFKDGTLIAGAADSPTLVLTNVQLSDAGSYHCEVTSDVVTDGRVIVNAKTLTVIEGICVPEVEKQALIALYNATNGPNWNNTWDIINDEPCDWYGVTVRDGHVVQLGLINNRLFGRIPTELSNLLNLEYLILDGNSLIGVIPTELGNLTELTVLNLGDNRFSGSIPLELANLSNLQYLLLNHNELSGIIPKELGSLQNLYELGLESNQLTGNIPPELGNLSNLTQLILYSNDLSGSIPSELGNLSNLRLLNLQSNRFSNSIPVALSNLSGIERILLAVNNLSGAIPEGFLNLPNFTNFDIYTNQFQFGDLEATFTNLQTISSYRYSPQRDINEEENHIICVEESLVLTTDATGTANHYQWFKDGTAITGAPDSPTYLIQSATLADAGTYHCEVTNDIVTGLTLTRRPIEVTVSTLLGDTHNTVTSRSYDITGSQITAGKQFFDGLGLLEQTQTWNIRTDETWASEVLRDAFDRAALQTLSAPIASGSQFTYKEDFVMRTTSSAYAPSDYQDPLNPSPVVGLGNTLGWYYSENNTQNPYQDQTEYPFSRTIYSTLNPGRALTTFGGNKINRNGTEEWLKTYSFTMPSGGALAHSSAFDDATYGTNGNKRIIKTVARDAHGIETVVFSDADGLVLGAARSGNEENPTQQQYQVSIEVGPQGYVDVHLPQGCTGITLGGGGPLDGGSYQIYDLITETTVTSPATLPAGFYRVAFTVKEPENPYVVSHQVNYYDYSLNEYDNAQRLVASYQPLTDSNGDKLVTTYEYNTLGQLIKTTSPDEGTAEFKYRKDGQIRYSQNSKQQLTNEVSFTDYDHLGRPIISGVIQADFTLLDADDHLLMTYYPRTYDSGSNLPNHGYEALEVARTYYDDLENQNLLTEFFYASPEHELLIPKFTSNNVVLTQNIQGKTWYGYDIYGRVSHLVQLIYGIKGSEVFEGDYSEYKTLHYEYDPINGLVNKVIYQKNQPDQFTHRYTYDEAYQLTLVETATNTGTFTEQARYTYNSDGSLKRTELAEGAQGMDYVYNLAGQLKAINHPTLGAANDPGGDDNDLFGMALDYHNNDYQRTNTPTPVTTYTGGTDQFNGNIKSIRWGSANPSTGEGHYAYNYDRNNWLTAADFNPENQNTGGGLQQNLSLTGSITTDQTATNSITISPVATISGTVTLSIEPNGGALMAGDYDVSNITYDANGNIQTLIRNKGSQDGNNAMDDLSYNYDPLKPNRLQQVLDAKGDVANADDIDNQTDTENYMYNSIGQLIENKEENIAYFYNTSGLVTQVDQNGQPAVKFFYNDRNHRIKKESYTNGILANTTYYVRDVSGQVMAIYHDASGSMALAEQPIYGSGRIGVAYNGTNNAKNYIYELIDHLGNVRAVFTKNGNDANLEGYTDYYPFGMSMPNRNVVGDYRYAFQGQEKDKETRKEAFQLRMWDTRIGRWLTTDSAKEFSSPYLGMGNNPIAYRDIQGDSIYYYQNGLKTKFTLEELKNNVLATVIGKDLIKEYANTKNRHVHLIFGSIVNVGANAVTVTSSNRLWLTAGDITSDNVEKYVSDKFEKDLGLYKDDLIGIKFRNGRNQVIVFDVFSDNSLKRQSQTFFHELKAHVDGFYNGPQSGREQHFWFSGTENGHVDPLLRSIDQQFNNNILNFGYMYPLNEFLDQQDRNDNCKCNN